jgi:hypothetical protein
MGLRGIISCASTAPRISTLTDSLLRLVVRRLSVTHLAEYTGLRESIAGFACDQTIVISRVA